MTEAPTFRCSACGGQLGPEDVQCRYCGSQVATLSCPNCFALVSRQDAHCPRCGSAVVHAEAEEGNSLPCPACRTPMLRSRVGETTLAQCGRCGGAWLAREAFDQLVEAEQARASFLATLPATAQPPQAEAAFTYRPCPACAKLMNRSNYARVSGVIVDTCRDHGLWFDRDELGRVLAFIQGGGLQKAARHEQAEMQQERERLKEAALEASRGTGLGATVDHVLMPGPAASLFVGEILIGVAHTLWERIKHR